MKRVWRKLDYVQRCVVASKYKIKPSTLTYICAFAWWLVVALSVLALDALTCVFLDGSMDAGEWIFFAVCQAIGLAAVLFAAMAINRADKRRRWGLPLEKQKDWD